MTLSLTLGSVINKDTKNEVYIEKFKGLIDQERREIQIYFRSINESLAKNEAIEIYITNEDFETLFEAMTQYKNKLEKEKETIHNEAI